MDCETLLKYLALCAGTWFWMWYLVWEYESHKGTRKRQWWNTDVRTLLKRNRNERRSK